MLWSILHLSYSSEPVMRLDYQILLNPPPKLFGWNRPWSLTINVLECRSMIHSGQVWCRGRSMRYRSNCHLSCFDRMILHEATAEEKLLILSSDLTYVLYCTGFLCSVCIYVAIIHRSSLMLVSSRAENVEKRFIEAASTRRAVKQIDYMQDEKCCCARVMNTSST